MGFACMNFIFMILLMIGGGLTVVGLVTPVWRHYIAKNVKFNVSDPNVISTMQIMNISMNNLSNQLIYDEISYGLISASCGSNSTFESCKNYFYNAPDWKKAALGCLAAAVALCALGFAWSLIACCMCCCTSCLTPPLPIFAGLACALDVAGVAVYCLKSGQDLGDMPTNIQTLESKGDFGYSMWVGIAAIVVLFVDMLIGAVLVKTAKISPI